MKAFLTDQFKLVHYYTNSKQLEELENTIEIIYKNLYTYLKEELADIIDSVLTNFKVNTLIYINRTN